jgi:acetoin utilization protein AcuC
MQRVYFPYTPHFQAYDMGPDHPMTPRRLQRTHELLDADGAFGPDGWLDERPPRAATVDEVAAVHAPDYLDLVRSLNDGAWNPAARAYGFGTPDNPVFPGIWEASLLYTGATIEAAEHVLVTGGRAMNIAGGLHHAHYGRAAGFCVLNDLAAAIARLLQSVDRVAYVDIDAHHGDGVQEIFYANPRVLTVSIHESGRTLFPGTGAATEAGEGEGRGMCLNVPLSAGTGDLGFLRAFHDSALPALEAFRPDILVTQLGADAHSTDPMSHLELTDAAYAEMFSAFDALALPWLATGGGGYNVDTTARIWAMACRAMSGRSQPANGRHS